MRALVGFLFLAACGSPAAAPTPVPVASVSAAPTSVAPGSLTEAPVELEFVKRDGSCDVVDKTTRKIIGRATSANTAAGGSEIACLDYQAEGKIIRFENSRGIYAKDARPGKDATLPCGEGRFANDVSSCVQVDGTIMVMADEDPKAKAEPVTVSLCNVATKKCVDLMKIPRGLNRLNPNRPPKSRWWGRRLLRKRPRGRRPQRRDSLLRSAVGKANRQSAGRPPELDHELQERHAANQRQDLQGHARLHPVKSRVD